MAKPWREAIAWLVVALAVTAALASLWTPGTRTVPPIALGDAFTAEQLERAHEFRGPQRQLGVLIVVVEIVVLLALAVRPPRRLSRTPRPVLAAAVAMAGLSALLVVVALPVRAVARERAAEIGLVTQSWAGWFGDTMISAVTGAAIAAAGGALAMLALRRWPRGWWSVGSLVIVGYAVLHVTLAPLVLDPLTSNATDVRGPLRTEVLALAERAGVDVGAVQSVDASERTTAANAYVAGLGPTKRVVLYDTLVRDFTDREVRSVVAHELGHVRDRDLRDGLLFVALVAPLGVFAAAKLTRAVSGWSSGLATPAVLPALVFALIVISTPLGFIGNAVSRGVEARADRTALELSGDPQAFVDLQQRLAVSNISDPDPPRWARWVFGTHPTTAERLAVGVAAGGRLSPP